MKEKYGNNLPANNARNERHKSGIGLVSIYFLYQDENKFMNRKRKIKIIFRQ